MNTIILAAGDTQFFEIVRGKPCISWVLSELNPAHKNIIVVRSIDQRLIHFLSTSQFSSFNIELRFCDGGAYGAKILNSLDEALVAADTDLPTRVILGDTFIKYDDPVALDCLVTSRTVRDSSNWCIVRKGENANVVDILDKKEKSMTEDMAALVGYYTFSNTRSLQLATMNALAAGKSEISHCLSRYHELHPLSVIQCSEWFDFGHVSGLVNARLALFNARDFNRISVDPHKGTITKYSTNKQKLLDEVYWYEALPQPLEVLAPRVVGVENTEKFVSVEMELFGYSNLAEKFVYGEDSAEDWTYILERLFAQHKMLESYSQLTDHEALDFIYREKTKTRLDEIQSSEELNFLTQPDHLCLNGETILNLPLLLSLIDKIVDELCAYRGDFSIVHGDYCYSNILFDEKHFIFRLIDPRGRFKEATIYGDPRYDLAKIRHSAVGLYDYIVLGMYSLKSAESTSFDLEIFADIDLRIIESYFDQLVVMQGFDPSEIKKVEAMLFLTMIPLHGDDLKRQTALYLTAIKKLNELL